MNRRLKVARHRKALEVQRGEGKGPAGPDQAGLAPERVQRPRVAGAKKRKAKKRPAVKKAAAAK